MSLVGLLLLAAVICLLVGLFTALKVLFVVAAVCGVIGVILFFAGGHHHTHTH